MLFRHHILFYFIRCTIKLAETELDFGNFTTGSFYVKMADGGVIYQMFITL